MISRSDIEGIPVSCGGWFLPRHYILIPAWQLKDLSVGICLWDCSHRAILDGSLPMDYPAEIGYRQCVHRTASFRVLVLAILLAASHVVFASHVSSHLDFKPGNCEWCVCQAQTLAGPLPSLEPVTILRQITLLAPAGEIPVLSRSVAAGYQSRAPPSSS
jgi:hypothetical protein